jgi:hypothetical protein
MLYSEIIAVCSEIHTKHINTLCGQNVELLNVKLVVHIVTTGLWRWFTEEVGQLYLDVKKEVALFVYPLNIMSESPIKVHVKGH